MNEIINFITDVIRIDIFIGFGFYSIVFYIVKFFLRDKTLILNFDKSSVHLITTLGIIWITLWLVGIFLIYLGLENEIEKTKYIERLTGRYSYGVWVQPFFWFLLTQLYRINFIKKYLIFRIFFSLLFVLTFERFVIIVTTLHQDYLPISWSIDNEFNIPVDDLIIGVLAKTFTVILIFSLYHFGRKYFKSLYKKTYNK